MKRTTIFLEDKLLREAKRLAQRRGLSFAMVVREAVAAYVARPQTGTLPSIAGQFSSGRGDASVRVDELLWKDPHS